jgi:hypothetical protein
LFRGKLRNANGKFGKFGWENVWSEIGGEEQDNLEEDLVDLERRLFGVTLPGKSRTIGREIW